MERMIVGIYVVVINTMKSAKDFVDEKLVDLDYIRFFDILSSERKKFQADAIHMMIEARDKEHLKRVTDLIAELELLASAYANDDQTVFLTLKRVISYIKNSFKINEVSKPEDFGAKSVLGQDSKLCAAEGLPSSTGTGLGLVSPSGSSGDSSSTICPDCKEEGVKK